MVLLISDIIIIDDVSGVYNISFPMIIFLFIYSERRPARSDLIVLVAHNDDPTGKANVILSLNIIIYIPQYIHWQKTNYVFKVTSFYRTCVS